MDSGSERGAWSQVGREGFLEDEETPGAGQVNAMGEDQDTSRECREERLTLWKKVRGPLKKTRGYRGSVGCREYDGRVYLSLSLSVFLSVSKSLLPWLFPISLLLHKMSASYKVLGKPRAASRKRGQGTRAAEPRDRR